MTNVVAINGSTFGRGINFFVESRAKVDEMIEKAVDAGGKEYRKAQDYGWMYGCAFEDIDRHIWEVFYMDESQIPEEMKKRK